MIDDSPGKPIQIWNMIGRRPILASGNSNGDPQMLVFAGGLSLPTLRLLIVHDDADRAFDYIASANFASQPNVIVMILVVAVIGLVMLMLIAGELGKHATAQTAES